MSLIKDGTGTGKAAKVNADNQLEVHATVTAQLHWYSERNGQAYSVIGITDTLTAATVPILHFKNISTNKELVIEQVWVQTVAEAATVPAVGIYFQTGFGRTYSSVGTAVVPTNLNSGSGNAAEVTVFHSTPVLGGTLSEIQRFYNIADGTLHSIENAGGIILAPNDTFEVSYVTTGTAGIATATVFFYMEPVGAG